MSDINYDGMISQCLSFSIPHQMDEFVPLSPSVITGSVLLSTMAINQPVVLSGPPGPSTGKPSKILILKINISKKQPIQ